MMKLIKTKCSINIQVYEMMKVGKELYHISNELNTYFS